MKPSRLLLVFLILTLGALGARAAAEPRDAAVVQILVTYRRFDPGIPWRREKPQERDGYGVVVGPGRVLTVESLVRNATLVEIRRAGDGTRIPCTVVLADAQANAALLSCTDTRGLAALTPVPVSTNLTRAGKVQIVQFDEAAQIQTAEGTVTEASVAPLPDAPWSALMLKVHSELHVTEDGAPVFRGAELAGLVMGYDRDAQASLVLPSTLLARFLADVATPPYRGVPSAGFTWAPLLNPDKRRYLGLADDARGVLVLKTIPGSGAAAALQPQDVVVAWDAVPVDSEGYYADPVCGRVLFSNLITSRHRPGDSVAVAVMRDRTNQTVTVTLQSRTDDDALIPENAAGEPVEYLTEGGLVIREVTGDYLRAAGGKWIFQAHPKLVHLYLTRAQFPEQVGDRVVILSGVLPDPVNVGYQQLRDMIVTRVNGQPVRNLADVFAVAEKDGSIERLTLDEFGVDVMLDRSTIGAANKRIRSVYNIPKLRYRRPEVSRLAPAGIQP